MATSTTAEGDVQIEDSTAVEINPGNVNTLRGDLLRTPPPSGPLQLKNPGFIKLSPAEIKKGWGWLLKNPHVGGLAFSCLCFFLAAIIFVATFARRHYQDGFWAEWETADPQNELWCEKDNSIAFMRQQSNARSTFSFLLVSFIIFHCAIYDFFFNRVKNFKRKAPTDPVYIYTTNRLRRFPTFSLAFGCANLVYAAGSFLAHSCYCEMGIRFDVTGLYAVTLFPAIFQIYEFYPVFTWFNPFEKDRKKVIEAKRIPVLIFNKGFSTHLFFIWIYLAVALLLFAVNEFASPPVVIIESILVIADILLLCTYLYKKQRRRYLNWRYLIASGLFLIFGLIALLLSVYHCNEETKVAPVQPYAVFTVFGALTSLFIFFYLRTEKANDEHQGLHYDPLTSEMVTMRASALDVSSAREGDELEDEEEDDAVLDYDSDLEEENPSQPSTTTSTTTPPAPTTATATTTTTSETPSTPTTTTTTS